jgi:hypothetical protein
MPLLLMAFLLLLATNRAFYVIRRVREQVNSTASPEKEVLNRLAFDFFVMYLYATVMFAAAMLLLISVLSTAG